MINPLLYLGAFCLSLLLVYGVRVVSLRYKILDRPKNNSCYSHPTALVGGVGFITSFFIGLGSLHFYFGQPFGLKELLFFLMALIIASVSLLADIRKVSPIFKYGCQFLCATGVYLAGFQIFLFSDGLNILNYIFTVLFIVGMTNIYNFMDGVEGYAGGAGIIGSISLCVIAFLFNLQSMMAILFLLSATLFGFWVWNYPKAKVFMGNVGSAFLGFFFAVLILGLIQVVPELSLIVPLIVFGVLIMDSSFTMIRRFVRGKQSQDGHYYQRLIHIGWSQRRIMWFEFCHMVINGFIALLYINASEGVRLLLLAVFFVLFWSKFSWISSRAKDLKKSLIHNPI